MKKILLGLLTISIIAIWGCTQKTRCYEIDDTEVEHLWCPKLDSSIVEWMPNVEKLTPYFKDLADCERFSDEYEPQHEMLKKCSDDSVWEQFTLWTGGFSYYYADRGVFSVNIKIWVKNYKTPISFLEFVAEVFLDVYGCTAFDCDKATKIHAYTASSLQNDLKGSLDVWLTPDQFKIEAIGGSPNEYEKYDYYHYYHLIVDSPAIKATIETKSENGCNKNLEWIVDHDGLG